MRTLTKERVNLSGLFNNSGALSMDLIGDGPNEVASRLITKFNQTNQEAKLKQREVSLVIKEKSFKQNFAKDFIQHYMCIFGITKDQLQKLVCEIKEENIQFIENNLVERLRKKARVWIGASVISGGFFIYEAINAFVNGTQHIMVLPFFISQICGWILPLWMLFSFFPDLDRSSLVNSVSYVVTRRRLKKKYGSDYFPVQELRKELGLVIDATEEK